MSIARSSRPLRSMTIGISGMACGSYGDGGGRPGRGRRRPAGRPTPAPRWPTALGDSIRRLGLAAGDVPDHLVDEAVFLGLDGGQVAVALGVLGDPLDVLAGVLGQDLVDVLAVGEDLLGLDL